MRTILLFLTLACGVQAHAQNAMADMPGMTMPGMNMSGTTMPATTGSTSSMNEQPSFIESLQSHDTSGTAAQPDSTSSRMLMTTVGKWTLMLHGEAFLSEIQQTGPRGSGKLFSTNWIMPMAQRKLGRGTLTLRTMLSFEPATITGRFYPELFQQGETAYGRPIVDGQHPHDFPMELAILYDYAVTDNTLLSFYAAPIGDPAMGPVAYPHRASASEDPIATLGHHLEDSTHISNDVITAGITHGRIRVEASGFHGREPDEFRWNIDSGALDSWSTRLTVNPTRNWSGQYSIATLHSPEALAPSENVRRMTASVMYNRRIRNGDWISTLLWGRNRSLSDGNIGNGYLAESTLRFRNRNNLWTRVENVDRTNDLLLEGNNAATTFTERYIARVQAYTAGYDREVGNIPHLSTAFGGQITWYGVPPALQSAYGTHPLGAVLFLRLRTR